MLIVIFKKLAKELLVFYYFRYLKVIFKIFILIIFAGSIFIIVVIAIIFIKKEGLVLSEEIFTKNLE